MPASPRAADRMTRSPMRAAASLTPANATAHRPAATGMMRRRPPRFNRDDRPRGEDRGEKRPYTPRGDRPNFNRDDRAPRGDRGDARPAALSGQEIRRQEALHAARRRRSEAALYAARRRFSQGRRPPARQIARIRRARRAMAIGRAAIGPSGNSAATRNFRRAARRTAVRARISAAGIARAPAGIARAARGSRRFETVAEARCFFARPCRAQFPSREARAISTSRASTSRARTAAARSVRDFRVRARIARKAIARFASGRNSTVPARPRGPSEIRASAPGKRLAGASAQRSRDRPRRDNEDDSKVFAKRPAFGGRGAYREREPDFEKRRRPGRRARRNPASASPRCCRGRGLPRAATPRNGSCRAASPSTAASSIRRRSTSPPTTSSPSTASRCRRASAPGCSCFTSRAG